MIMVVHYFPFVFFFNDTATTEIYTLSLHDALPIVAAHHGGIDPHAAGVQRRRHHVAPAEVRRAIVGELHEAGPLDADEVGDALQDQLHAVLVPARVEALLEDVR